MVMQVIVGLGKEGPVPSMLVEVVDNVDDMKNHNFLETTLVAQPLLGVGVLIGEASNQSSQQSTMMRVSREINQSV